MFDLRNLDFDFQMAYTKANEILATTSVIETFPYKIGELIKEQSDIRLCKYSKALSNWIKTLVNSSELSFNSCKVFLTISLDSLHILHKPFIE